ncbi:hypothetical protein BDV38DRAFT_257167 [Aspergillus pseudotamarii]|uniref:Uncharacterized protein n=1 Tax=Aspergillus pseudotamarii TaxID=132259 RepID=A0A5N6SGG9_ASPPS|nr:uncharacterized protein BDV38DRAFT_257167 [Aspergillus pseudotamarii]KAE8133816.1 hypothetical protein BDV38DRAFT_257167 [Aspergillus pseudotamarii]
MPSLILHNTVDCDTRSVTLLGVRVMVRSTDNTGITSLLMAHRPSALQAIELVQPRKWDDTA